MSNILKRSGGILYDDISNARIPGAFSQTPKYSQDSSQQNTMARFYIGKTLVDAMESFYSMQASSSVVLNALSDKNKGYFDFLLTNISESVQDRYQLSETMGENFVVFGFNSAPVILTCTGVLKNTVEDDWQVRFLDFFKRMSGVSALAKFYQNAAPGSHSSSSVENFVKFVYNKQAVRGALLNVSHSLTATNEMDVAFSFSFLVTQVINNGLGAQTNASRQKVKDISQQQLEASAVSGNTFKPRAIAATLSDTVKADGSLLLDENEVTSHMPFDKYEMEDFKNSVLENGFSQEVVSYDSNKR